MVHEGLVDGDRVGGGREGGKSRALSWGDKLFGCPDVLGGCFDNEISPVGSLGSLDGLGVP